MSLVALGSVRGAPGVTTLAIALAATWPTHRQMLLWEADGDGGVIAARYGLGDEPGSSSLAAAVRQQRLSFDQLTNHTQQLPGGTDVVLGAATASQAKVVLDDLGRDLGDWFSNHPGLDVIADCGRLSTHSPALAVTQAADIVLLCVRPLLEDLRGASARHVELAADGTHVKWVLIGNGPYAQADVQTAFGVEVVAVIADDPKARLLVEGGSSKALARSGLIRSARTLASDLCVLLGDQTPSESAAVEVTS